MTRRFIKKFDTGISKHLGENYEGVSNHHADPDPDPDPDPDHIIYQLVRTSSNLKQWGIENLHCAITVISLRNILKLLK
ncbi:hypothetical protein HW423_03370 [Aerococcaceae bacterium INB8]|uniref:Uncharacterized protein n=1 Tax=Ruoffia halotolerans TaxID=2748684 RepID=A0A839A4D0_9LACT|nr:hypothetical protein [Ruoffia halotolerans]MBA5728822.1 hypothetical protein [Ruoffia halotolerans]